MKVFFTNVKKYYPTCPSFISVIVIKYSDDKSSKMFILAYSSRLQLTTSEKSQQPELEITSHITSESRAREMNVSMLTFLFACDQVSFSTAIYIRTPCIRNSATHRETGLPMSINLIKTIIETLFSGDSGLYQFNHHTTY